MSMAVCKCADCEKLFIPVHKKNANKYCTRNCYWQSLKGKRFNLATEFRKGQVPWNYKGDAVGYDALHRWVRRKLGIPKKCRQCESTQNLQWANKSHKYKRDLQDWISLCVSCHMGFDGVAKLSKREAQDVLLEFNFGRSQKQISEKFNISQPTVSNIINGKVKFYQII